MQLSNSFTIGRPPAEVFEAFLDVERIASCMPGSKLLGQSDENTYDGEVSVKVGPLSVAYSGTISMLEIDREQMTLTMRAKGREKRGAGNADAYVVAQLRAQDGGTHVQIDTELNIRGKVAQFGRGAIADVTDGIMQTFAQNVEQLLSGASAPPPAAPSTVGAPAGGSIGEGAGGPRAGETRTIGPDADTAGGDLDAWSLIIRPMLGRYARDIVTVAASALAAYVGARAGARPRRHARCCNKTRCCE